MSLPSTRPLSYEPGLTAQPEVASPPATDMESRYSSRAISGWGRYPVSTSRLFRPSSLSAVSLPAEGTVISRGQGRSYGDAAIASQGLVIDTRELNQLCRFDTATGILVAEAGLTFKDLLSHVVPYGWFPPVTPGTKHVSLGGADQQPHSGAADVQVEVMLADGTQVPCGPWKNPDLFWATVGGMGLTGIVSRVTLQLIPIETASIMAQHFKAPDLDTVFRWLDDREHDDQYTVAWIDCLSRGKSLGRSVLIRGHHATQAEAPSATLEVTTRRTLPMPYDLPSFAVNRWSVAAFNQLYYTIEGRKTKPFLVDFDKFFYPLDLIQNWNRMYGRRGFLQYQFMIPEPGAADGSRRILERLAEMCGVKRLWTV